MAGEHHAIAVVGSGPRGTSVLERLCASAAELASGARLTVHVVDPAPPGSGQVWRTAQSGELLMNTVASQVTLFTDASVDCAGPVRPGPSLYEWAAGHGLELAPDDYPTRALYGRYLEWVFARVVRDAPDGVTVRTHAARAVRLEEQASGEQVLTLDDGGRLAGLSAVVLAQGHLPAVPDEAEERFAGYAAAHGLRYYPPANPADLDLSPIAPGEPVLLRGLGLNFFDHMALLTLGRGGAFTRDARGTLTYVPSGREPRLYAGSRRGIPYHARGDNAKGACGRHEPLLLTPEVIALFRKRAEAGDAPDFLLDVWPLVAKETETVYYEALLRRSERMTAGQDGRFREQGGEQCGEQPGAQFRERFLATEHGSAEEAAVLDAFGIPAADRWSWEDLAHPYRDREFADAAEFRRWLLGYLREDVAHARLGNVAGPVKAALDVLRDLRNELRQIVDHRGLRGASRRAHLDRWYTPLNAFLSIGPPRLRIEEMAALIEAGVLHVLGPGLEVTCGEASCIKEPGDEGSCDGMATGGPGFRARSARVPGPPVVATTLIEARLPEPDVRRTADELLAHLLRTGGARPHRVDGYETGGLDVTPSPYRVIDGQGRAHPRRFAVGVPTEGVHWVTAAGARPGVNSVTLCDTDAVARAALRAAVGRGCPRPGYTGSRTPQPLFRCKDGMNLNLQQKQRRP
ncbi:FAD/NAD(P)-binding domain-containing protein [Streptomyces sp. XD-27]|uniref:FAD/NAD(P)-binding protein n=1 Tax=Streptomyces sp. XD-27 TaxID=3062779 RepID=UPI0026F462D1|nr:FAD/NAD(P)-binding protein [Streptomyces sp. XD-27]WKX70111.1 FAD/NAD(P)-binding protein [Streptomyces sp. XD-27]